MKTIIYFNEASVDATVAAAFLQEHLEYQATSQLHPLMLTPNTRIISIGNRITFKDLPLAHWEIFNKRDPEEDQYVNWLSRFKNYKKKLQKSEHIVVPDYEVCVQYNEHGEIVQYGSYFTKVQEVLNFASLIPNKVINQYENMIYKLESCDRYMTIEEQAQLYDLHQRALKFCNGEVYSFDFSLQEAETVMDDYQRFLRYLKKEISNNAYDQPIKKATFWKPQQDYVKFMNASVELTQWIFKIVGHSADSMVVYQCRGDRRHLLNFKYFNPKGYGLLQEMFKQSKFEL